MTKDNLPWPSMAAALLSTTLVASSPAGAARRPRGPNPVAPGIQSRRRASAGPKLVGLNVYNAG